MPARVLSGVLLVAAALAGAGSVAAAGSAPRPASSSVSVTPTLAGKHDRVAVTITTRHATGVFGRTRRGYVIAAHAIEPASACVNNRDRFFTDHAAGRRARAYLDPARGEGGPTGWCRGPFRGTVTYDEGFACPPAGTCRPPHGFPSRRDVVAHFTFRVR